MDLLEVYLNRWGIERMFQQVVEVFGLSHLMGTTPEGTICQFSLCLLLYNLIQVMRGVIAVETGRQREDDLGEKLFEDVQREMIAWSVTIRPEETIEYFEQPRTAVRVKARLSELLSDVWKDRWLKCRRGSDAHSSRSSRSGRIALCTGSWKPISSDSRKRSEGSQWPEDVHGSGCQTPRRIQGARHTATGHFCRDNCPSSSIRASPEDHQDGDADIEEEIVLGFHRPECPGRQTHHGEDTSLHGPALKPRRRATRICARR